LIDGGGERRSPRGPSTVVRQGPLHDARRLGPTGAGTAQGEPGLESVDRLVPRASRRASSG
jgi:hypothetical protein